MTAFLWRIDVGKLLSPVRQVRAINGVLADDRCAIGGIFARIVFGENGLTLHSGEGATCPLRADLGIRFHV